MSLQIAQLSPKCEPLVSASSTERQVCGGVVRSRPAYMAADFLLAHPDLLPDSGLTDAAGAPRHQVSLAQGVSAS